LKLNSPSPQTYPIASLVAKRSMVGLRVILIVLLMCANAHAENVQSVIDAAKAKGLPTASLINKIREGSAKKIAPDRIKAVVKRLATYMEQAQSWLAKPKHKADPVLLAAVAEARLAGISEAILRRLLPAGSVAKRAKRVDALVDLHLRGYAAERALQAVLEAPAGHLASLGQFADQLLRNGLTRAEVLDSVIRSAKKPRAFGPALPSQAKGKGYGGKPATKPKNTPKKPKK